MRNDIWWWLSFGLVFCSKPLTMVSQHPCSAAAVGIDACGRAAGAFFMGDAAYTDFSSINKDAPALYINHKEILALLPALQKWVPFLANRQVHVYSDNVCAVRSINKGTSRNPLLMESLRSVFWLSVMYNFRMKCHYYPGQRNVLADAVSRHHEKFGILRYDNLLTRWYQTNAFNSYCCIDRECLCQ